MYFLFRTFHKYVAVCSRSFTNKHEYLSIPMEDNFKSKAFTSEEFAEVNGDINTIFNDIDSFYYFAYITSNKTYKLFSELNPSRNDSFYTGYIFWEKESFDKEFGEINDFKATVAAYKIFLNELKFRWYNSQNKVLDAYILDEDFVPIKLIRNFFGEDIVDTGINHLLGNEFIPFIYNADTFIGNPDFLLTVKKYEVEECQRNLKQNDFILKDFGDTFIIEDIDGKYSEYVERDNILNDLISIYEDSSGEKKELFKKVMFDIFSSNSVKLALTVNIYEKLKIK